MTLGLLSLTEVVILLATLYFPIYLYEDYSVCKLNAVAGSHFVSLIDLSQDKVTGSQTACNNLFTNQQVLSVVSNYPSQRSSRKFKFDGNIIDPVTGSPDNRKGYLELLSYSKENENSLIANVPKGKELAQLIPVELLCIHLSQLVKCIIKEFSRDLRDDSRLHFKSPSSLTWLVYKGSHGKVVVGYLTTPSSKTKHENSKVESDDYHSSVDDERYTEAEREFLYVDIKEKLNIDTNSEFYKRFKPANLGNMANVRIYFHGNDLYYPGWLEEGTTAQVVIKGEIRLNNSKNDMFWVKEREYTFFLSSTEVWRLRNRYLNFIPGIFSIYYITNDGNDHLSHEKNLKNIRRTHNNLTSRHLIKDVRNGESNLPEFMIMEYTKGIRFFELLRRFKSVPAVYFYNATNDWQGWFKNALYLFHLSLHIVSTFSTTGRYLYMHCDLHGNNIIVHGVPSNTLSRVIFTNVRKLVRLEKIKLIDLMFVWTPKEVGDRNKSNPCTEGHEVAISDIECLTSLVLGRLFLWDNFPFDSTPEKTDNYLKTYRDSKNLFEFIYNIPEWRRISSYYVGGGPEWFNQWKSIGKSNKKISINTFNEQFEGIMVVCDYLHKFLDENGIPQEPCFSFESYLRGYNLLSYRIMRIGSCIKSNIHYFFSDLFNLNNEKVFPDKIEISYWEISRLTLILYWNILATNMNDCIPLSQERDANESSNKSYMFEFSSRLKGNDVRLGSLLGKKHCDLIFNCLDEEDRAFKEKYDRLYTVNENVNGFKFTGINGTSSLTNTFSTFVKDTKQNVHDKNSSIRSLKNLKLETINNLNGRNGIGVSEKSPSLIKTQKVFDYEEFLLDRWIYNLYYQYSFSPSIVLIGIRYSFRVEPTLNGKAGKILHILDHIRKSAVINGFISRDSNPSHPASSIRDISEAELVHSCYTFYLTYYEIALGFHIKKNENCSEIFNNICSDVNYARFARQKGYQKYRDGVESSLFTENGEQELMIIDETNICTYNYLDIGSNNTPNSEFIRQGFCDILIKPLKNIKISL